MNRFYMSGMICNSYCNLAQDNNLDILFLHLANSKESCSNYHIGKIFNYKKQNAILAPLNVNN